MEDDCRPILMSMTDSEDDAGMSSYHIPRHQPFPPSPVRRSRRKSHLRSRPRSLRTPSSPLNTNLPNNNLPSAPASPPTPAPSPSPQRRFADWSAAEEDEEALIREHRIAFAEASVERRQRMLAEILNLCTSRDLTFVHDFVCPRLKRDPFAELPDELSLRVRLPQQFLYISHLLTWY